MWRAHSWVASFQGWASFWRRTGTRPGLGSEHRLGLLTILKLLVFSAGSCWWALLSPGVGHPPTSSLLPHGQQHPQGTRVNHRAKCLLSAMVYSFSFCDLKEQLNRQCWWCGHCPQNAPLWRWVSEWQSQPSLSVNTKALYHHPPQ